MYPRTVFKFLICLTWIVVCVPLLAQAVSEPATRESVPSLTNPDRYRLQANDVLDVQYRYSPEYNDITTIQPDGFINLPLVGDVKVSGLTLEQARKAIIEKAAVRLKDPEIVVKLKEFEKPSFVVSGHVKNPGRFDFRGKVMASEAIAIAGGLLESSKSSQVLLLRKLNTEWSEVIELNFKDNKDHKKQLTEDVSLRPGDMLVVPQNRISKIERIVKNVAPFNPMGFIYRR